MCKIFNVIHLCSMSDFEIKSAKIKHLMIVSKCLLSFLGVGVV